jgi:gamma-glutamylcyclotransferase (GGCT)/AIG2-like uncharacterized protein YtfP
MYDLHYYPAVCQGHGKIKAELHSVEDEPYKQICRMEDGAGYKALTMKIDNINATIYVMDKEKLKMNPKIKSGDWD